MVFLPVIVAITAAGNASAGPHEFQSGAQQVTFLELYTSEGCSSCPAAEAWLSRMKDSPELWKSVVPVAFHVDYWDNLGWKDSLASRAFTDRQRAYATLWNSSVVYTPAFVRNGREWRQWGGNDAPSDHPPGKPGVLDAASVDGREWKITFNPGEGLNGDFEVHVALLASGMRSNVRGGENGGKQLVHDFAALAVMDGQMQKHDNKRLALIKFSDDQFKTSGKLAVAVWVTQAGEIVPVQATGGWLSE